VTPGGDLGISDGRARYGDDPAQKPIEMRDSVVDEIDQSDIAACQLADRHTHHDAGGVRVEFDGDRREFPAFGIGVDIFYSAVSVRIGAIAIGDAEPA